MTHNDFIHHLLTQRDTNAPWLFKSDEMQNLRFEPEPEWDARYETEGRSCFVLAQGDDIFQDHEFFTFEEELIDTPVFRDIIRLSRPRFEKRELYTSLDFGYRRESNHLDFPRFLRALMRFVETPAPERKTFVHLFYKDEDPSKALLYEELVEEVAVLIETFGPVFGEHGWHYYSFYEKA